MYRVFLKKATHDPIVLYDDDDLELMKKHADNYYHTFVKPGMASGKYEGKWCTQVVNSKNEVLHQYGSI